jgi:nicotinamidase/pyrazinamidase
MEPKTALLIVDVQNDFSPGGALAVPEGDSIVPVINQYITLFGNAGYPVFASRDWHPPRTRHFKDHGGLWPVHCVAGTSGAEFHPDLALPDEAIILSKGIDPAKDGYSAFEAVTDDGSSLDEILKANDISCLYICGLATDYCVKNTALDCGEYGYRIVILSDAVRGVDLTPGDSQRAIEEMQKADAEFITLESFYG